MGLAASQARLLSITSRMSDNELRSQLISNAKMRLTSDSARVSDEYVAALNKTQLMFQNFDAQGNELYQSLTFNSLTAYSAYNNQYGIVNGAGEILVSASDAANFKAANSIDDFLACYGLEKTTTYFDNIINSEEFVSRGGIGYYDNQNVWQQIDIDRNELQAIYEGVSKNGVAHYGQTGSLNSIEYGDYEKLVSDYNAAKKNYKNEMHNTIKNVLNGTQPIKYNNDNPVYFRSKDGKSINEVYSEFIKSDRSSYKKYYDTFAEMATTLGLSFNYDPYNDNYNDIAGSGCDPAISCANNTNNSVIKSSSETFINSMINNHLAVLSLQEQKEISIFSYDGVYADTKVRVTRDENGNIMKNDDNTDMIEVVRAVGLTEGYLVKTGDIPDAAHPYYVNGNFSGSVSFQAKGDAPPAGVEGEDYIHVFIKDSTYNENWDEGLEDAYVYETLGSDGSIIQNYTCYGSEYYNSHIGSISKCTELPTVFNSSSKLLEEDFYEELKSLYEDFIANLYDNIDPNYFLNMISNNDESIQLVNKLKAAKSEYEDAAKKLAKFIWGETNGQSAFNMLTGQLSENVQDDLLAYLDDPKWVLSKNDVSSKDVNGNDQKISVSHFNPVQYSTTKALDNGDNVIVDKSSLGDQSEDAYQYSLNYQVVKDLFILDCMMEHYGTPNYVWVDKNNENSDGQAKATWYSNLFARMQKGYKVLGEGLGNSKEWMQYAFESGLVHMEQVNKSSEWVSTMYSNCSHITENAVDIDVTVAEAKYKREMAKIEAKDKQYDMELKNIDTEHESLKQEYESIKKVIGKNIERNFKLFQNA